MQIEKGDRIGLVGPNGEGKTTLLRILAGFDAPTDGMLTRMRGLTIGYLPQDPPPVGDATLWDDVAAQFDHLRRQAEALHRLEERMADPGRLRGRRWPSMARARRPSRRPAATSGSCACARC